MIQFTAQQAAKYRQIMMKTAETLSDDDAAYVPMMFERWMPDVWYEMGKRVCYNDKLYKVLISHTSQDSWKPDLTPSLFAEVLIPDPSVIPDWVQPSSTNPYMKGDKVRHHDKIWESAIDYNVYEPDTVGTENIWIEVT